LITDKQNLVIDKASKIIDILNLHLDETPQCQHSLNEIIDQFLLIKEVRGGSPQQQMQTTQQQQPPP
jgi:hypothetical protein